MSFIFSYINYCNLIWGSANKTTLEPLFKLQKKAVRLVNNSKYLDHTEPIFKSLRILTIHKVFMLNCLTFLYKCLKCGKYPEFKKRIIKNSDFYSYHTRGKDQYRLPRERLELCRNSFFVKGVTLWNSLDEICKSSVNIHTYKRNIKRMLVDNTFPNF